MAYVTTHRVKANAKQAVAWAVKEVSEPYAMKYERRSSLYSWRRRCLAFVNYCYGFSSSPSRDYDGDGEVEAYDYWRTSRHRHTSGKPPIGALVCWRDPRGGAGHISIVTGYARDGETMIASNDIKRSGRIDIVRISEIRRQWGYEYLGWCEPDFPTSTGDNPEINYVPLSNDIQTPTAPSTGGLLPAPTPEDDPLAAFDFDDLVAANRVAIATIVDEAANRTTPTGKNLANDLTALIGPKVWGSWFGRNENRRTAAQLLAEAHAYAVAAASKTLTEDEIARIRTEVDEVVRAVLAGTEVNVNVT